MATFGIEEEYAFVDPLTLLPRDEADAVYRSLQVVRTESPHVQREFLQCQLERPSPVFTTAADALLDLGGFRRRLAEAANTVGVIAAGTGTFAFWDRPGTVTNKARYGRVVDEYRSLAPIYYLNGLHVHIGVPDREAGIVAMNALRSWMPVLAAIAANSPLWRGTDTGFSSWRTINLLRWATHGTPPEFADAADYDARSNRIVGVGATFDRALIAWNLRPSDRYPTIEVRVADAQLETWQSVLIALLLRGLVATVLGEGAQHPPLDAELIDAALWHAARDGLEGQLVHPFTGELQPARAVADALLSYTRQALDTHGDTEAVTASLERLFAEGTGAARQRKAFAQGGVPGLAALLRNSLTAD